MELPSVLRKRAFHAARFVSFFRSLSHGAAIEQAKFTADPREDMLRDLDNTYSIPPT